MNTKRMMHGADGCTGERIAHQAARRAKKEIVRLRTVNADSLTISGALAVVDRLDRITRRPGCGAIPII